MSDEEESIPIAVGQDVNVETSGSAGKIVGTIVTVLLFILFAYGIYYFFFKRNQISLAVSVAATNKANAVGSASLGNMANMIKSAVSAPAAAAAAAPIAPSGNILGDIFNVVAAKSPALGKFANLAGNVNNFANALRTSRA